ncbi:MAG: hypothetical protein JETCAE03_36120 [Ignavibacteriaceae bacterium]|jgi:hypothetical protein|nr:MAG: hypothetical protein JETCAE03_36120 [Ignavibacteriaceae bacterium]
MLNNYKSNRKYHFIYKTTNLINGRYYFGMHSTDKLDDGYLGSGDNLWKSIRKYGKENFKREIVEFCKNREELVEKEKEIVNLNELSKNDCMNLVVGGGISWSLSATYKGHARFREKLKNDKEFRKYFSEMSSKTMKKTHSEGKLRHDTFTGKHHTDETKRKIGLKNSKLQKGKKNSQFGTIWITNGIENKKILKTNIIPENWFLGRKMCMSSYTYVKK